MIQLFDLENGGTISFSYDTSIPAISGYMTIYGRNKTYFHFYDGVLSSGILVFENTELVILPPGVYLAIPRIVDANGELYFLPPVDLEIVSIPPEN